MRTALVYIDGSTTRYSTPVKVSPNTTLSAQASYDEYQIEPRYAYSSSYVNAPSSITLIPLGNSIN